MESGASPDVVGWTQRITAVGRSQQWQLAVHLLTEMQTFRAWPNEITFGACMSACARASRWQSSLQLMVSLRKARLQPNTVIYNTALAACEKASQWAASLQLFGSSGGAPDLITYNSLISTMGRPSRWRSALSLVEAAKAAGFEPDRITLNAAMNACSRAGCWEWALTLLHDMLRTGPAPCIADFNVAISAMDEASQWERAQTLLLDAEASALDADIVTHTSMVSALGSGKQWEAALGLLLAIIERRFQPQLQTYNVALSAVRRAHAWRHCMCTAETLSAAGLHRDIITQNELVRASALAGQWQCAHSLLRGVGDMSCQPTRITFNAALQGFQFGQGVDLAIQLLDDMQNLRLSREPVDFSPVILGLVAADRVTDALQVLDSMLVGACGKGLYDIVTEFPEQDRRALTCLRRTKALPAVAACLTELLAACERAEPGTRTELALLKLLSLGVDYAEHTEDGEFATGEMDGGDVAHEELLQLVRSLAPVGLAARLAACGRGSEASLLLWDMLAAPTSPSDVPGEALSRRAALSLQAKLCRRPLVYLPTLPPWSATFLAMPPKRSYARELSLLRYVLMKAKPGSPASVCEAVEAHSRRVLGAEGMWSKFAGGGKADCLVAAAAGSAADSPVLEIGTYCGYATLRLVQSLPHAQIISLESDPMMVVVARAFLALSGRVAEQVDVRTGHSRSLLPTLSASFGLVFMDIWGSQYIETCQELDSLGLLRPRATVVADNVLETGAILYLWHVANPAADFRTQVLTVEFTSPGRAGSPGVEEDWLTVSVARPKSHEASKGPNGPKPPPQVLEAHRASERMREMVFSPGHSVTAKERSAFCAKLKGLVCSALPHVEPL
ncbi:PTAC2 [Symbiodinium natans]|uniref:PTAC2 protein n=1 Tax=Symbiodinium natans TaxID=878477 RepID=A0A812N256_9DINO|nr:PTAC2 [Symbiodinium natans]